MVFGLGEGIFVVPEGKNWSFLIKPLYASDFVRNFATVIRVFAELTCRPWRREIRSPRHLVTARLSPILGNGRPDPAL